MSSSLINRTTKKIQREEFVPALLRYAKGWTILSEIFSDSARGNFPKNQDELIARLKNIERCINNEENLQNVILRPAVEVPLQ